MKRFLLFVMLACVLPSIPAVAIQDLSPEEVKEMKEMGLNKVKSFQIDVNEFIMNKDMPEKKRLKRMYEHTLLLFVDEERKISVSSGNIINPPKPIKDYLNAAVGLCYGQIEITYSQLHYTTRIKYDQELSRRRGGEWYSAEVAFIQEFLGKNDIQIKYRDVVQRSITVHFKKTIEYVNGKQVDTFYPLLGDCHVKEIISVK